MDWHDWLLRDAAALCALLALVSSAACSPDPPARPAGAAVMTVAAQPPAAAPGGSSPAAPQTDSKRLVTVNGQAVPDSQLEELERHFRLRIVDGNYWYDRTSGAAGPAGGPTLSFIVPGLDLGGPLSSDASAGNTGVFINGRELPQYDLIALTRLVGFVQPGRYFLDANGNAGFEGGAPMINLVAASRQAQAQGGGDGWYSGATGAGGNESGGAGYVMGKDGSGNTWISSY